MDESWLNWAVELQSLAQAGLTYGKDVYDRERYERIREIAAEMVAHRTDIPLEKVKGLFCNETGYQTPNWTPGLPSSGTGGSSWCRSGTAGGPSPAAGWR